MTSELSAPLGRRRARAAKAQAGKAPLRLPIARLAVGGIVLLLGSVALRVIFVESPEGGRPFVEVAINGNAPGRNSIVGSTATPGLATIDVGPEVPADGSGSIMTLEPPGASGGYSSGDLGPELIADSRTGIIADLAEETEHGQIPRMSATGQRPFDLYARPAVGVDGAQGRPLVAVVVTGLGINPTTSVEAAQALPEAVTMAFAPYGKDLAGSTAAARNGGHELFLEVPLEPFDYPDNDPGPDTLLTGKAPRENLDKLFNVMGSFGGYVGLINNMGARFTSSGADFGPMIEELGARGLGYLDDGSSNRSLAEQLAMANRVPFARAQLTLDVNPTRADILGQLTALEEQARSTGSAIGVISALPISISTLAEWTQTLESRGIELVPASTLMK